jgi:hypothetical protein
VCQLLIGRGEQLREIVEVKFRVQYSGKALGQPLARRLAPMLGRCYGACRHSSNSHG